MAILCLTAGLGAIAAPARKSATPEASHLAKARRFEFTYIVRVPAVRGRQLRVWVPLPHSDASQTITRLRIESPIPYTIERMGEGNRDAFFQLTGAALAKPHEIRIEFDGLRRERVARLPSAKADPPPGARYPASVAFYLRPDRMIPLGGEIGEISRTQTRGMSDPLAKARKLYEYVIAHMRYDKSGTGWGHGDAIWACSSHRGNCTDFHSLFIGLVRAAGIPARFKIGFLLPEGARSGPVPGYHCWAEFYLQGTGWVPIDAAEAWLHPQLHNFYFGSLDANRVLFTTGRDLRLNPPQHGQPLNYFVYPYAELDGKPFDGVKPQFSFRNFNEK